MNVRAPFFISWRIYVLLTIAPIGFTGAYAQKRHAKPLKPVAQQSICGTVVEKRGNYMPGPDRPTPTGRPVERDVLIFPLLNINQVDAGENGFINSVRDAKPVATVKSKPDGTFCANVPPGRYSLLVREPKGLYANQSDTQNNIFPVTVEKGKRTQVKVEITHQAVF